MAFSWQRGHGGCATHELTTNGTTLRVNMVAAVGSSLQVGVTAGGGVPLPGLSAAQCVGLSGNLLDQEVIWHAAGGAKGGRGFGAIAQPFRLQFVMHGEVDLFSFRFGHRQ